MNKKGLLPLIVLIPLVLVGLVLGGISILFFIDLFNNILEELFNSIILLGIIGLVGFAIFKTLKK